MAQPAELTPAAGVLLDASKIVAQRLLDSRQLSAEYHTVVELDSRIDHTVFASQQPENVPKNRYTNVLPYDYNFVTCGPDSTYLNASTVHAEDRTSGMEFRYICCQGPLPTTVVHFWRMVLEQQTPAIVMLTNLVERGAAKCARYFPDQPGETLSPGGGIQVTVLQSDSYANGQMTERVMQVSCSGRPAPASHTLRHYHFHAWPDHGTPRDSHAIRGICAALQAIRQQQLQVQQTQGTHQSSQANGVAAPGSSRVPCCQAVVHCSAGIGRTGTFLALDIMIQRIRRLAARASDVGSTSAVRGRLLSEAFNIPTLVHELRQQRMGMVQTFDQYAYIYRALQEELMEELAQLGVVVSAAAPASVPRVSSSGGGSSGVKRG